MGSQNKQPIIRGFPTYPIMMFCLSGPGPAYRMRCCCQHEFVVDARTEQNCVRAGHDGELREVCPNCFGMAGMSQDEHAAGLREASAYMEALRKRLDSADSPRALQAWHRVTNCKVWSILSHAEVHWVSNPIPISCDLAIQVSEPLGLRHHRRFPTSSENVDGLERHVYLPQTDGLSTPGTASFQVGTPTSMDTEPVLSLAEQMALGEDEIHQE